MGIDVAWAFQPFLAFMAAALALALAGLLRGVVESPIRRAAVAALAAQPALVYSFALQGSIKELATLWLVPLLAALVPLLGRPGAAPRTVPPPRRGRAPADPARRGERRRGRGDRRRRGRLARPHSPRRALAGLAREPARPRAGRAPRRCVRARARAAVASDPARRRRLPGRDEEVVTSQVELGNLFAPLPRLHVFGIWLQGDYRIPPDSEAGIDELELTYMLIGIAALSAVLGGAWLLRRRGLAPLLFIATSLIALWYVTRTGSPWADAKALAIAAPAVSAGRRPRPTRAGTAGGALGGAGPRGGAGRRGPGVERVRLPRRQPRATRAPRRARRRRRAGGRPRAAALHGVRGDGQALPARLAAGRGGGGPRGAGFDAAYPGRRPAASSARPPTPRRCAWRTCSDSARWSSGAPR